jgi:hypothetical protein
LLSAAAQRAALVGNAKARVLRPRAHTGPNPTVSVVIPCYNYGRYLAACTASVLEQPGVDVDIVIVDDASPDGSAEVVRRLVDGDSRIRAVYHETNKGHIATYNDGLALASGEYVVLLSADDLLVPGALGRATALMAAYPSVGLVYGATLDFSDRPGPARTTATTWTVWQGRDWAEDRCRKGTNALRSPEAVMRTSVFRQIGGYRADLPHSGDFAMWLGAAMHADVGYVGGADQAYYRVHAASMSQTVNADLLIDLTQRLRAFDTMLDGAPDLLAIAHRAMAREALGHAISAHARGAAQRETVDGFVDFAHAAYPDAGTLREWRVLRRVQAMTAAELRRSPSVRGREAMRDLTYRLRWRRWRRAGL